MKHQNTLAFAQEQDKNDPLRTYREKFHIPQHQGKDCIYFCGNSLGLQPKTVDSFIQQELADWKKFGVEGHFKGKNPWLYYHHFLNESAAKIVGAKPIEVVVMNSLTVNLHLMMVTFYRPDAKRYKILVEGGAFPSDQYAVETQSRFHGFEPDDAVVEMFPRENEKILRTEDIVAKIAELGDKLALVMFGGVNYYTGQAFDMEAITKAGHKAGAKVGFDLAHAAGNILLNLHDWNVDFAVWCSYKYMNSGPGGTSGAFVHERFSKDKTLNRFAGWWGHEEKDRFLMKKGFIPMEGAAAWQLSNAQIFPMAIHRASLEIFEEAGMPTLRQKSEKLIAYLEFLIGAFNQEQNQIKIEIITPKTSKDRGSQLSLVIDKDGKKLFDMLTENGVIADWREPDVIRIAAVPLYNSFQDCYKFYMLLKKVI